MAEALDSTTRALIDCTLQELHDAEQPVVQEIVHVPVECIGLILGRDQRQLHVWQRNHDVEIQASSYDDSTSFLVISGKQQGVTTCIKACSRLVLRSQKTASAVQPTTAALEPSLTVSAASTSHVHVVIDWSNFELGAKADSLNPGLHRASRVNVERLHQLLIDGRMFASQQLVAIGSNISTRYARTLRGLGYDVTSIRRAEGQSEVDVDDQLHGVILSMISSGDRGHHLLVLLTGDGNANKQGQGTSFLHVIQEVKRSEGWDFELWSWRRQCSKLLADACLPSSPRWLDEYVEELVSLK